MIAKDEFDVGSSRIVEALIPTGVNYDVHEVLWKNLTDGEVSSKATFPVSPNDTPARYLTRRDLAAR